MVMGWTAALNPSTLHTPAPWQVLGGGGGSDWEHWPACGVAGEIGQEHAISGITGRSVAVTDSGTP
jgi:hypothetical protein